jgi:hypothetical protein
MNKISFMHLLPGFIFFMSCGPKLDNPIKGIHNSDVEALEIDILLENEKIVEVDGAKNKIVHIADETSVELIFKSRTCPSEEFMAERLVDGETWGDAMEWTWTFWQVEKGCQDSTGWKRRDDLSDNTDDLRDNTYEIRRMFSCSGEKVDNGCWRIDVRAKNPNREGDSIGLSDDLKYLGDAANSEDVKGVGLKIDCIKPKATE